MGLAAGWERGWGATDLIGGHGLHGHAGHASTRDGLEARHAVPQRAGAALHPIKPHRAQPFLIHLLSGVRRARPRGGAACVAMNNPSPSQPPCAHAHPATASFLRDRPEPRLG